MGPHFKKLFVCGLLVVGLTATGQEADQEEAKGGLAFVDEVQVTVVNIDVFVRDRQGNAVTDLSKEQSRLLQDGQERKLSNFAAYTDKVILEIMAAREEAPAVSPAILPTDSGVAGAAPDQGDSPADFVQPVHIVLYVDNENIRPFDRNRVLTPGPAVYRRGDAAPRRSDGDLGPTLTEDRAAVYQRPAGGEECSPIPDAGLRRPDRR